MIPLEQAEEILNKINCRLQEEKIPIMNSLGRILAQDIVSEISMPPFNKSAMDGYAIGGNDHLKTFKIIETIAAGSMPINEIKEGTCAKIMTGGVVPKGADRVVKKEVVQENDGWMTIMGEDKNLNICYKGEDVKPGDLVLKAGTFIRPPEVGIIASMGFSSVKVYKQTTVGIITTGTEIKEPGQQLRNGQIYNSNAYSIASQVKQAGGVVTYEGIVSDNKEEIKLKIKKLLAETQIILISGGVSAGDFDFVPQILKDLGVQLYFEKVAIQPGKPTVFGTYGNKLIFGMPGNPVSTFVVFEVFVKTILYRAMGYQYSPSIVKGVMENDFKRKRKVRTAYIPVIYHETGVVETIEYHGSAHLYALAKANGLLEIPRGVQEIPKGEEVYVRQI